MAAFVDLWSAPAQNVDRFTDLLDPRIRLIAPGVPTTIGWRKVAWANVDRVTFKNGAAVERQAYFDPTPIRLAFLTSPRGWRQFATILWGR